MKCIIIEDQAPAQKILQRYIAQTESLSLENTFFDALEAQDFMATHSVELIFLDINLPRLSGLDFLANLQNPPLIILTTAFAEFALASFQFTVVDYLLKPFSYERFEQAIAKVNLIRKLVLQNPPEADESEKQVYVKSGHQLIKIDKQDILFIRADSDYTEIITEKKTYVCSENLKDWVNKLDVHFKQSHKSFLVNLSHVQKIALGKIHLSHGHTLPIGRVFKKSFLSGL